VIITRGRSHFAIIDNRPVWALSWGLWRFAPDEDHRRWFWWARLGPLKFEAVRCCHERVGS
jgi:hypothetical protein